MSKLEELFERYKKGEITREEYNKLKYEAAMEDERGPIEADYGC